MGANAIAQRLDRLHDQWVEFSLMPEPRILRWVIKQDEYRMIETWLMKEGDDTAGELPDLFLRFTPPFEDMNSYGTALLEDLKAQYAVVREELESEGMEASWQAPPAAPGMHSMTAFVGAARSLAAHYADELEQLVLVLTPSAVHDPLQWQGWLVSVARSLPSTIRIIVLDDAEAPALDEVAAKFAPLVHTSVAGLEMPEAMLELARAAGTSGPDGQFRVQFAALSLALGKRDQAGAEKAGNAALAVAQESGWTQLVAAVHFALASGLLGAGNPLEAVVRYRQVDAAGRQLEQSGDALGTKLRMHSALATGSAYVSAGAWLEAAKIYESAVPLARAASEPMVALDAWRMASYCYEQNKDPTRAWEAGQHALKAGESIPNDQRAYSMLPFTGQALLRMAAASPPHLEFVNKRMSELMGTPNWLPKVPGVAS
jgi:tetratricopeptide (TPR) repeat protein